MNFIQKIDLFSQPFTFFIGESNKKKNTSAGGLLSLFIIFLALGYFGYLLYLYFDNQILPKITTSMYNQQEYYNMTFSNSLIGFTYFTQGKSMDELEQSTGKKYLTFELVHATYQAATLNSINVAITDCINDADFVGYKCIDIPSSPPIVKTLFSDPRTLGQAFYQLTVSPCIGLPNCATSQEIYDAIMDTSFTFFIKIRITQFNEQTRSFEQGYQIDYLQFDDQLALSGIYYLQRSQYTINTGLFVQNNSISNNISTYRKNILYNSMTNLLKKAGFSGYAEFQFCLDQTINVSNIQFPMITEVLASFVSIFNILLTLGFIVKYFAEQKIIEDVNNIYLKEYYKNTAISYLEKDSKANIIDGAKLTKASEIQQLKSKIDQFDFSIQKRNQFTQNFYQFIKQQFFSLVLKLKKQRSSEQVQYEEMIQLTSKRLNIYTFYKELIKLKQAIRLILNKDQYAALQFCGCNMTIKNNQSMSIPVISTSANKKIELNSEKPKTESKSPPNFKKQLSQISNTQKSKIDVKDNRVLPINVKLDMEKQNVQELALLQDKESIIQLIDSNQHLNNNNSPLPKTERIQENLKQLQENIKNEQFQDQVIESISNHLQEIEDIDNSDELLSENFVKFMNRINNNQGISQIDKNIYASLIGFKTS